MQQRVWVLAAALTVCGALGCVQRAVLLPVLEPIYVDFARDMTKSTGPGAVVDGAPPAPIASDEPAERYIMRPNDSTLEAFGGDLLTGSHKLEMKRWRAQFLRDISSPVNRPTGKFTLDINLTPNDNVPAYARDFIFDSIHYHLLEVQRFPHALFTGTIRPRGEGEEGYVFQGRAVVHGVERVIRFQINVEQKGDGYRLSTEFQLSRSAFDMRRKDSLEYVIYDDLRVVLDLVAHPENVTVETLSVPSR
ncbi:MAG: YceI family protein [Polyangiaceae bacterium]|nr:YceI family protein [Polyangiaceae bacterium]